MRLRRVAGPAEPQIKQESRCFRVGFGFFVLLGFLGDYFAMMAMLSFFDRVRAQQVEVALGHARQGFVVSVERAELAFTE